MQVPDDNINWSAINAVGDTYLVLQKKRVGFEARQDKLEEQELIKRGLAVYEIKKVKNEFEEDTADDDTDTDKDTVEKKVRTTKKLKLLDDTPEGKEKAAKVIEQVRQSREYTILLRHILRQKQEEKELLKEALELFDSSRMWKWCLETKGLGDVAGMTFASFINPEKMVLNKKTGQYELCNIDNIWSHAGLIPGAKLKRGQTGHFSPIMKGRLRGVVTPNVIRSADPYYKPFYNMKKDYFLLRPDILDEFFRDGKQIKKGYRGAGHEKSLTVVCKLLISHAFELMLDPDDSRGNIAARHRNPVPIKPSDPSKWKEIHERYAMFCAQRLEELKKLWLPVKYALDIYHQKNRMLKNDPTNQTLATELTIADDAVKAAKEAYYSHLEYD